MKDSNGVGEGPYTVKEENGVSNLYLHKIELEGHTNMFLMDLKTLCKELNTAYGVGAKSERERCLKIVNDFCPCHDDIVQIEKRIREG